MWIINSNNYNSKIKKKKMYIEDEKRKSVILEDGELHTFISSTFFFPQDDPLRIVTIFRNFPFFFFNIKSVGQTFTFLKPRLI